MEGRRRRVLVCVIASLCGVAAPAQAVVSVQGNTWYSDGSVAKSGGSGMAITAFATDALANADFQLKVVRINPDYPCSDDNGPIPVNSAVRRSSSRGFIPYTTGRITSPPGEYQICFYTTALLVANHARSGTAPVALTVV